MPTSAERILQRLQQGRTLDAWRRKNHVLRQVVLGDYSSIDEESPSQPDYEAYLEQADKDYLYDILVADFEEGATNKMLQSVRTLVQQAAYKFPDILFEDLPPNVATLNSLYIKKRLGPKPSGCYAVPHMRLALADYIVGGMGWAWTTLEGGKPAVKYVDSLRVTWDTGAIVPDDGRFVGVDVCQPLHKWIEEYGEQAMRPAIERVKSSEEDGDVYLEMPVTVTMYWDTDGEEGTQAAFLKFEAEHDDEPLELTENPHRFQVDGYTEPFLPLEPIYFLQMPSTRFPVSICEMVLPHQTARRIADRALREAHERGAPYWAVEEGAYEEAELDKLQQGEVGQIVKHKAGKPPASPVPSLEVAGTTLEYLQLQDSDLTAQSGANPYASGNKVTGIQYASEVHAIQSGAGLQAASLASDHASHWSRIVKKTLANSVWEEVPCIIRYEGVQLEFGLDRHISQYLQPDAEPSITDDTMRYEDRDRKLQRDNALLQAAMSMMQVAPKSAQIQYERMLQNQGEMDVARHFEVPEQMALPGTEQTTEAQSEAQASTQ